MIGQLRVLRGLSPEKIKKKFQNPYKYKYYQ